MTAFNDPLKMLRSLYSHADAMNHQINLADDSKRRWVGFSCVGCIDEYITWECPVQIIESHVTLGEYSGEDRLLVSFMRDQTGRTTIREAINRYVFHKVTTERLNDHLNKKPVETTESEIRLLEDMFMDDSEKQVLCNEEVIIEVLSRSFRNNIPSRYEREPVI